MSNHKSFSSINENSGSAFSSPVRAYGSPSRKKQVVPYSPRSPDRYSKSLFSPSYKVNNANSPSSKIKSIHFSPKKKQTLSNAEFTSMLENPPQSFKDSFLGQAIFDLSIGLRSLDNVLKQILNFRLNAPLKYYSYASLLSLINASTLCPPDVVLQLLNIGKVMITKHNYAKPQYLRALIKITKYLISKNFYYVSYGRNRQDKPKRKLERLLKIFTEFLDIPQFGPEGDYETAKVEDIMSKNHSFNEDKLEKEIQRRKRKRDKDLKNNNILFDKSDNDYEYENTEITGSFIIESDLDDIIKSDKIINSDSASDKKNIQENLDNNENKKSEDAKDIITANKNTLNESNDGLLQNEIKIQPNEKDNYDNLSKSDNKIENESLLSDNKAEEENNFDDLIEEEVNDLLQDDNIKEKSDDLSGNFNTSKVEDDDNLITEKQNNDNNNTETKSDEDEKARDSIPTFNDNTSSSKNDENVLTEDDENLFLLEDGNENSTTDDENLILGNSSENILTENDDDLILQNDDNKSETEEHSDAKSQKDNYVDTKIQTDDLGKVNQNEMYHDEKSQTEDINGIYDDNLEKRSNFEDSDRMSSRSWKSSLTESVQFSIDIEPELKNQNGEENIQLRQLEDSDPNIRSIERFIRSTDTLYERREKGKIRLENLSPEQREKINVLASLFNNWKTAYASSRVVWNTMKADNTFDVNILLYQIPVSYGDFLIEALTTFAEQEGILIQKIESPL